MTPEVRQAQVGRRTSPFGQGVPGGWWTYLSQPPARLATPSLCSSYNSRGPFRTDSTQASALSFGCLAGSASSTPKTCPSFSRWVLRTHRMYYTPKALFYFWFMPSGAQGWLCPQKPLLVVSWRQESYGMWEIKSGRPPARPIPSLLCYCWPSLKAFTALPLYSPLHHLGEERGCADISRTTSL